MKHNKKILMGVVAGMALAAVATGGVASFAWYTVTAQGSVKISEATSQITAVKPSGNVAVSLPLDVDLGTAPTNLELAHYFKGNELLDGGDWSKGTPSSYSVQQDNMTEGLYTAFHLNNADKTLIYNDSAIGQSNALWANMTINLKAASAGAIIDGVEYTKGDIATLLNNKKVNVKVEGATYAATTDETVGSGKQYYEKTNSGYTLVASPTGNPKELGYFERTETRAKVWGLGTNDASAPVDVGNNSVSETTNGFTLSDLGGDGTNLHFGIYLEGVRASGQDSDDVDVDYTVIITQH